MKVGMVDQTLLKRRVYLYGLLPFCIFPLIYLYKSFDLHKSNFLILKGNVDNNRDCIYVFVMTQISKSLTLTKFYSLSFPVYQRTCLIIVFQLAPSLLGVFCKTVWFSSGLSRTVFTFKNFRKWGWANHNA